MIGKVQIHEDLDDLFSGPAEDIPENDLRRVGCLFRWVESSFAAEQGLPDAGAGGWRSTDLPAAGLVDGPMDGTAFLAYVEEILAPALAPRDIVVLQNRHAHRVAGVREAIEAAGAGLVYVPRDPLD